MKKTLTYFLLTLLSISKAYSCGPYYEPDSEYYNLFMQEIIDDPKYYPFLLTLDNAFYSVGEGQDNTIKNENIEEWQAYFNISYDDAYYLVFSTGKEDIDNLIEGRATNDVNLKFATSSFVKKYKSALHYLSYAKYLEPYMAIVDSNSGWNYYSENRATADQLDYNDVIVKLQVGWKETKENELKLRYGYQLVRLAHYTLRYKEAIDFFDTYVEPLNYKPAMYYHTLSQKAGAERGLGDVMAANTNFFRVFSNSKNLKEMAVRSMRFNETVNYQNFIEVAKTVEEKNDAYLLFGYFSFNNPLNSIEKIIQNSPDAIQAKVLMARAINTIERDVMALDFYFYYSSSGKDLSFKKISDKRYPLFSDTKIIDFFNNTLVLSVKMSESKEVKDKNYWYLTTAYLYFLNKDFVTAKNYLAKVKNTNAKYTTLTKNLAMYIDIAEMPRITASQEVRLYKEYKNILTAKTDLYSSEGEGVAYSTQNFIIDVLANRYFLQGDFAKSFLLHNDLSSLTDNPDLNLLMAVEDFYKKTDKNEMEQYIAQNISKDKKTDVLKSINYIRGIACLTKGDLNEAAVAFRKSYQVDSIPSSMFGYNKIECFSCSDVMETDYLNEFPFIKPYMSGGELAEALIRLQQAGIKNDEKGAKANYLFGNFYYNITVSGYYREFVRFGDSYFKNQFFRKIDIYDNIYFKYYQTYYENPVSLSQTYLEKAYKKATNDELKARIVFALSKCEQEAYNEKNNVGYYDDNILIKDRFYFKEMMKYKQTVFFDVVKTNCKYFDYYVNTYTK